MTEKTKKKTTTKPAAELDKAELGRIADIISSYPDPHREDLHHRLYAEEGLRVRTPGKETLVKIAGLEVGGPNGQPGVAIQNWGNRARRIAQGLIEG